MDGGWIENSAIDEPSAYLTTDAATFAQRTYFNPKAASDWPQEETTYARVTIAIAYRFLKAGDTG